jgi:hypothetical protein
LLKISLVVTVKGRPLGTTCIPQSPCSRNKPVLDRTHAILAMLVLLFTRWIWEKVVGILTVVRPWPSHAGTIDWVVVCYSQTCSRQISTLIHPGAMVLQYLYIVMFWTEFEVHHSTKPEMIIRLVFQNTRAIEHPSWRSMKAWGQVIRACRSNVRQNPRAVRKWCSGQDKTFQISLDADRTRGLNCTIHMVSRNYSSVVKPPPCKKQSIQKRTRQIWRR